MAGPTFWRRLALALPLASVPLSSASAQRYEAYDAYQDYGPGTESFIDDNGNIVTVDSYGRVIAVEAPREQRRAAGRPTGGMVLEGRRGEMPPGVDYGVPQESYGAPGDDYPFGSDPFEAPIARQALPAPGAMPDQTTTGSIESETWPNEGGGYRPSVPGPEGTTIPENNPAPRIAGPRGKNAKAEIAALQVILDRSGISPGVIDGRLGSNVDKAVAAYTEMTGRTIDFTNPQALLEELDVTGGPAITSYEITNEDLNGPYVASIPDDYGHKALLPAMSYTRVTEMLAERFHMDEEYLKEINPGADFNRPGTILKVMNTGMNVTGASVARIVADKGREQVRAYDATGRLVVAYPSSIGSTSTPSPTGTVEVARIAFDPNYTYNPKINFKQGENDKVLTIPPGPNGPVGTIWIALSKPTYGIHGTPEPSKIGKTNSHGCVRLTNWDATELAKLVSPGVVVEFQE